MVFVQDQRSREFSQGNLGNQARKLHNTNESDLKLPPIVNFDSCLAKQREFDNVITCHRGYDAARSWRKENFVIGKHKLRSTDPRGRAQVTAVCMSACGNYALVGSANGWIDKFNIQSGQHRASVVSKEDPHRGAIQALAVDAVNRYLVSASLDGTLKVR
jgi:U3 small nucleolar RNA-associated protein 21